MSSKTLSRREFLKGMLVAGLVPLVTQWSLDPVSPPSPKAPNVLFLVCDALSAQHMSLYGYPRQTTPHLERLASQADVYHANHSAGNFTSPGTASILTGVYPWRHRAFNLMGQVVAPYLQHNIFHLAAPGYYRFAYSHNLMPTTLMYPMRDAIDDFHFTGELSHINLEQAENLFPNDYNAALFSELLIMGGNRPSSFFLSQLKRPISDFQKKRWDQRNQKEFPRGASYYLLSETIDWIIRSLAALPQPFLAYLHLMPPHDPYNARFDFIGRFADSYTPVEKPLHHLAKKVFSQAELNKKRLAYDEFLAYTDSEIGRLYDHLQQNGLMENTCLIFTSDHGEMFERGIWHHDTRVLYQPLLHVPLIIHRPGQQTRLDIHTPTSSVDLLPTLLQIMRQPASTSTEGRVLPGFTDAGSQAQDRPIYAMESKENPQLAPQKTGSFVLLQWPYKLIHYRGYTNAPEQDELYHLENDPQELNNLAQVKLSTTRELRALLDHKISVENQAFE